MPARPLEDVVRLVREARDQRQRQEAVRDRGAAGHLALGAFDVDVDPLVVAGGVGELVDHRLIDRHPVAGADPLADVRLHVGGLVHDQHRAVPLVLAVAGE